jgi:tetratricopeptide (TPR) repeat protein
MAEQEEPVRRKVALKVIKLGMDTKSVIARFEAERQALALMDHPNIAKVFDAGATDTGRPFFVMELVRGIKITDYCDQECLPTERRLELFVQVCQAIQHAHQKGIIHRDIKPSNILVTLRDGVPVPKVIDFGIAKATTDQRLTDKTLFTQFEMFIGTPAYMSPEQAEMNELGIDTRSDIYSLGILLYELLTGTTPFDAKELMQSGIDEIRRIIREQEPVRPSTRLTLELAGADVRRLKSPVTGQPPTEEEIRASSRRLLQVKELARTVHGELDWIVMKALEKDRSRRYETANGLAADVQRYLSDEPVVACPPSQLYRFQKLVRRNKLAFAAASAVAAALAIGLTFSTWQAIEKSRAYHRAVLAEQAQARLRQQAETNEKKARTESAKSQQVARFLKDMLEGVEPSVALGRDTKMLREILDQTAQRVGKDLKDQPEVEAELRSVIGTAYKQLRDIAKAEEMHREALRLRRALFGGTNALVAASLRELAFDVDTLQHYAEAETLYRESLAMRRQLFGNEHRDVAESLAYLAHLRRLQGNLAESETMFRDALAMGRRVAGIENRELADLLRDMAGVLREEGKLAEAEDAAREALKLARKLPASQNPFVADALNELGGVLRSQGRLAEAEAWFREALAMCRKVLGENHPDVQIAFDGLVTVLNDQGKRAEVETLYREELAARRKLLGNEHPEVANFLHLLADVLYDQGKRVEAEGPCRDAIALFKQLAQADPKRSDYPRQLGYTQWRLADVLRATGRREQTEPVLREALQVFEQAARDFPAELLLRQEQGLSRRTLADVLNELGRTDEAEREHRAAISLYAGLEADAPKNAFYYEEEAYSTWMLAIMLERAGRRDAAATEYRQAIALHQKASAAFPNNPILKSRLAQLLREKGTLAEAEKAGREALAAQRKLLGNDDPAVAGSLAELTLTLLQEGKFVEAEPLARECLAIREKKIPDDWRTFNAQSLLGGSLLGQKKYGDAEPLLLSGYEGMKLREAQIPSEGRTRLPEATERLAQLYGLTARPGPAAEWKKRQEPELSKQR